MQMDNITPEDILQSMSLNANREKLFEAGEGAG